MRNLIFLIIIAAAGFVLVGMYVAPSQPGMRTWYLENACVHLDKISPQLCAPVRAGEGGQRT